MNDSNVSDTHQQQETAESQTEHQRTSQVGVFKDALLGRSERVEDRQRLQRRQNKKVCGCVVFAMSLPNEKIMKMFFVYQRTQTSTVSCSEIISEYVCSLQYRNIPKNASNSKATAQYLWEKYQMNRFKRVITVLQKKRNFYQIRFTN